MSFPAYEEYKDSGVEWLGEVPGHWDVSRCRRLFEIKKEIAGELGYDVFSITQNGFRIKDIESGEGQLSMDYSKYQLVHPGQFAMNPMDLITGGADIAQSTGVTSPDYRVFQLRPNVGCDPPYLLRVFQNCYRNKIFWPYGRGSAQLGRWRFPRRQFDEFSFPIPPLDEQTAIASFLDTETSKIDALVDQQRRLIELLKEKRQAVISHAVTKGLNPNVKMKDSGIEWLGEVPEHWEMKRLGWICTDINDINHEMPKAVEDGVLFLSAKDLLNDGTLNFTDDVKMIGEEDYERLSQKIRPRRGDIIYSRIGAALGKARLVETDVRFNVSYSCCVVRLMEEIACRRFIRFLLDGEMILTEARMRTKGIGVPDLGLGEIARFPIPLPPVAEQEEIVSHLEHETGVLTRLLAQAERAIELLQERRTALISAAVTGKIDVREFATAAVA